MKRFGKAAVIVVLGLSATSCGVSQDKVNEDLKAAKQEIGAATDQKIANLDKDVKAQLTDAQKKTAIALEKAAEEAKVQRERIREKLDDFAGRVTGMEADVKDARHDIRKMRQGYLELLMSEQKVLQTRLDQVTKAIEQTKAAATADGEAETAAKKAPAPIKASAPVPARIEDPKPVAPKPVEPKKIEEPKKGEATK